MIFSFEQNEKNYVRNSWAIKTAKPHNHRNNFRNWNATENPGVPSRNKPFSIYRKWTLLFLSTL